MNIPKRASRHHLKSGAVTSEAAALVGGIKASSRMDRKWIGFMKMADEVSIRRVVSDLSVKIRTHQLGLTSGGGGGFENMVTV
jgi:hypothetical protein